MKGGKKKNIVFFTPTFNKTGSELVLFNLLPFAKANYNITVITKYKGELFDQLPDYVDKHYLVNKQYGGVVSKIANRIRAYLIIPRILKKYHNAVWYINTILLPEIVEYAQKKNIKVIIHLHELQQMYSLLSEQEIERLTNYPFLVIANSKISANVLKSYGSVGDIEIIYPAINTRKIALDLNTPILYRKRINVAENTFLWAMCGTLDKNKNPVLFIDIACELKKQHLEFKMMWIGASAKNSNIEEQCRLYAKEKNVEDVISWLGEVGNEFYNYFAAANGFVLTSEYESFSMVTVEALLLGLPVVANNCGGVSEILANGYGFVSREKNNAKEMADKMKEIMAKSVTTTDKQMLIDKGNEFDSLIIGKAWIEILNNRIVE